MHVATAQLPRNFPTHVRGAQGWNSQPTAAVYLDNVRVPSKALLGPLNGGFKLAMRGLNGARLSIASCSLGAAASSIELARAQLTTRRAFGKPLAAQQGLQFELASMATKLHMARLTVRHAAGALDQGHPSAPTFAALAKRAATELAYEVVDSALQMHGGYGYLSTLPLERHLRDLRVHRILEGANEVMSVVVARALLDESGDARRT